MPHEWKVEDVKEYIIKLSKFRCSDVDESCNNEKLDIPLNNDGNPYDIENLKDDQCQAFYHVMKTMQDWITYNILNQNGNLDKKNIFASVTSHNCR